MKTEPTRITRRSITAALVVMTAVALLAGCGGGQYASRQAPLPGPLTAADGSTGSLHGDHDLSLRHGHRYRY